MEECLLLQVWDRFFFQRIHGRIHCVEDEKNYHTQLCYERILYLNCASLPDFNLSLIHFRQILLYFCLPLVLSLEASFLPNILASLLKPIILVHSTVIFTFFYLGKLHIWLVLHIYSMCTFVGYCFKKIFCSLFIIILNLLTFYRNWSF